MLDVLPYVLVIALAATAWAFAAMRQHRINTAVRRAGVGLVTCTLVVVYAALISGGEVGVSPDRRPQLVPFRTIGYYLSGQQAWRVGLRNLRDNLVLLVPLGFGLGAMGVRVRTAAVAVVGVPVLAEGFQLAVGRSSDIDDVILNVAGGVAGLVWWHLAARAVKRRLAGTS